MIPSKLPWVLWEFNYGAKKPWLYSARVLAVVIGFAAVGQVLLITNPSLRAQWRNLLPYFGLSHLLWIVGIIAFVRLGSRSLAVRNLVQERREGTLALLLCTPRRPIEIVLSKLLPTCGMYVGAALAVIPVLLFQGWFQTGLQTRAFIVFGWVCSLIAFYLAVRVALSCTRMEEKTVQVATGVVIFASLTVPPLAQALFPGSPWIRPLIFLNPIVGITKGTFDRFVWATVLNLVWSSLCVWAGARWLTREVYPVRGRLGFFWHRMKRRIKRVLPWQERIERWLLENYPIAWLNLRTFAWAVYPLVISLAALAAGFALWNEPDKDMAGAILGFAVFIAFALVISVRAFVDRTVKTERETRMAEVIHPLPIAATKVVVSRLIESAFWVGPSLVLVGMTATAVAAVFLSAQVALVVLLEFLETVVLSAIICLGTHIATRLRKSWIEREQWVMFGIGALLILILPFGSLMLGIAGGPFVGFILSCCLRLAVESFLAGYMFRWLARKIANGEGAAFAPPA